GRAQRSVCLVGAPYVSRGPEHAQSLLGFRRVPRGGVHGGARRREFRAPPVCPRAGTRADIRAVPAPPGRHRDSAAIADGSSDRRYRDAMETTEITEITETMDATEATDATEAPPAFPKIISVDDH